ncbi:MAG: TetR/AcrR family transcriptional regulator [Myxococcales bacterium]|jgi:AcrR family transcriptional regulator
MAVTKDEIADVVEAHLARHGFERMTVDEIASKLGISKKTLYQHFETKQDVYAYVFERIGEKSRAQLAASVAGEGSCRDKVLKLLRMILVQARGRVVRMGDDLRGEHVVAASACAEAYGSLLEDLLEKGRVQGEFAITSPALAQRMVAAMLNEYSLMLSENLKLKRDEELVAAIARFLG